MPLGELVIDACRCEEIELFQGLESAVLDELRELARPIAYRPGSIICREGGPTCGLYALASGAVAYGKSSGRGDHRRILKLLEPGNLFGEETLFQVATCDCPGFARALTDVSVFFFERTAFLELADRHPVLLRRLCEWVTRQLKVSQCKLVESAYESAEQNLLRLLLLLVERFGVPEEGAVRVDLPLSRGDLSELLGVHPDTIIHTLGALREEGLIRVQRDQLLVSDEARLRALAGPLTTCLNEHLV